MRRLLAHGMDDVVRMDSNIRPTALVIILVLVGCGPEIKVWTEKTDAGVLAEEYQYYNHTDSNLRMKHGWYNSYHSDGGYRETGIFKDNERDGEWVRFLTDRTELKGVYRDGKEWTGKFLVHVRLDSTVEDWEWALRTRHPRSQHTRRAEQTQSTRPWCPLNKADGMARWSCTGRVERSDAK